MSRQRGSRGLKASKKKFTAPHAESIRGGVSSPQNCFETNAIQNNGQDFSDRAGKRSIGKIAGQELLSSDNLVLIVENFDATPLYPTVPFGIADCCRLGHVPE
jgi:hypothetical protein